MCYKNKKKDSEAVHPYADVILDCIDTASDSHCVFCGDGEFIIIAFHLAQIDNPVGTVNNKVNLMSLRFVISGNQPIRLCRGHLAYAKGAFDLIRKI